MNKGFTLIELLATIVIISIIMTIVLPSAVRVSKNNQTRIYEEYEKMMVEYAKVSPLNNQDTINFISVDENNPRAKYVIYYYNNNQNYVFDERTAGDICNNKS